MLSTNDDVFLFRHLSPTGLSRRMVQHVGRLCQKPKCRPRLASEVSLSGKILQLVHFHDCASFFPAAPPPSSNLIGFSLSEGDNTRFDSFSFQLWKQIKLLASERTEPRRDVGSKTVMTRETVNL